MRTRDNQIQGCDLIPKIKSLYNKGFIVYINKFGKEELTYDPSYIMIDISEHHFYSLYNQDKKGVHVRDRGFCKTSDFTGYFCFNTLVYLLLI